MQGFRGSPGNKTSLGLSISAMKPTNFLRCCVLGLLAIGLATAGLDAKSKPTPALYLSINTPPVWDALHEADIANSFHGRISEALRKTGFAGEIESLSRFDDAKPGIPVLVINLMEWRADRVGNVVCTFSSNLKSGADDKSLGIFSGTAPQWMTTASRTWELRRGLDDSAASAIKSLVKRLQSEKFLPPPNTAKGI
ncbi:MAG: hypothetical protein RIS54_2366 [Verrucomicrobiota bacterium]|jgi:hypothetical protein